MKYDFIIPVAVACIFGAVLFLSLVTDESGFTFGGRCSKAGYEGAALEFCIC